MSLSRFYSCCALRSVTRRTLAGSCLFPLETLCGELPEPLTPPCRNSPACGGLCPIRTALSRPFGHSLRHPPQEPAQSCPFRTNSSPSLCHSCTCASAHWRPGGTVRSPDPTQRPHG